jgi:ATP-dependent DNA helicase RecG
MHNRPVTDLKGAGPRLAEKLVRLGIHTCEDLLFHLPLRYQDRTRVTPVGGLRPEQTAVIEGRVMAADVVYGRRRSLLVRVGDGTGMIALRFFHFSAGQKASLEPGRAVRAFGETRPGASGLELYHPEYESTSGELAPLEKRLTPVYPATEGVSQPLLRRLVDQALMILEQDPPQDFLAPSRTGETPLPSLQQALMTLHAPSPDEDVETLLAGTHPAIQRLVMEELVAHQLGLLEKRASQRRHEAPVLRGTRLARQLLDSLPFTLTGAQQRVIDEIRQDLTAGEPMLRLLQGDVGSGKTLVAAAAALNAIESGYQVALMAPTEVLAEQHLHNFRAWLEPLGLTVVWLAGSLSRRARADAREAIAEGRAALVVGTHALFQESVQFRQLGLTLIDEQHRFGVHQRLALREKGRRDQQVAHQLVMTATPIPRTLAMSAYGDLDTSVIDELPRAENPLKPWLCPTTAGTKWSSACAAPAWMVRGSTGSAP